MKQQPCRVIVLFAALILASCGGGDGDSKSAPPPTSTNPNGASYGYSYTSTAAFGKTAVGVQGLEWAATVPTDATKQGSPTTTQTGFTNLGGEFLLTFAPNCTTTTITDPNTGATTSTTTCIPSGVQPPQLKMCDAPLPQPAAPVNAVHAPLIYSAYDLAPDEQSALNLQSAWLMANTNSGDPLKTGIVLPDYKSLGVACNGASILWGAGTADFQQSAAGLLAASQADGKTHVWHSDEEVRAVARASFIASRVGDYMGRHFQHKGAGDPELGGNAIVVVDLDGTITGWLDFSDSSYPGDVSTWPTTSPAPISFSAQLADHIAAGGKTVFTVQADSSPWPNTTVTMEFGPEGVNVTYQTADGAESGSSKNAYEGMMNNYAFFSYVTFPKYQFLLKNVSYTRPGHTTPENFIGEMTIGYDNSVTVNFWEWPPLGWPCVEHGLELNLSGSLDPTTNVITIGWLYDLCTHTQPTKTPITLQLDPTAVTVSGTFIGFDGKPWTDLTFPGARQ